jgi:uroporphyrinogen-III synthase
MRRNLPVNNFLRMSSSGYINHSSYLHHATTMSTKDSGAKEGIPVLLLKTKSTPNDGYQEQFSTVKEGHCFEPAFVPVLEHQFLEEGLSVVRELLQSRQVSRDVGANYGGLIFTSQRAVEAFAKLVEEGKGKPFSRTFLLTTTDNCSVGDEKWPHLQDIPIYTVGPATSRALRSIPQTPPVNIFGSETGNGEALAHYMLDHYKKWYEGRELYPPVLFLVGEQRRDIIPKTLMDPELPNERRIQVDELVVYGTGVMESFEQDFTKLLQDTEDKDLRWVVVFSPTGCEAMLRALGMLDPTTGKASRAQLESKSKTYIATIGPTTRDYLRNKFDFEPDVCAAKPSPEGVEDGIRSFMKSNSR